MRGLRRRLFGISPDEVTFARRGFWCGEPKARQRLEQSGKAFLQGYHTALEDNEPNAVASRLNIMEDEFRGFAFEGAAMGLALLDGITPWRRNRLRVFIDDPGRAHLYMVHVGAGWALARLPWQRSNVERPLARLDPLLRWLALDGYGFHEGYFHWNRSVVSQAIPDGLSGYAFRAFDQGLGRSLWFMNGADVTRIPATIAAFSPSRQADLWSGVGLACTYAGGAERAEIEALLAAARAYAPDVAQGAVFAAKARQRAATPAPHTDLACRVLCGLPADVAAGIADEALEGIGADGHQPAYETWRGRIRERFIRQAVTR